MDGLPEQCEALAVLEGGGGRGEPQEKGAHAEGDTPQERTSLKSQHDDCPSRESTPGISGGRSTAAIVLRGISPCLSKAAWRRS